MDGRGEARKAAGLARLELGDRGLDGIDAGTDDLEVLLDLTVLEELEGRHGAHALLAGNVLELVDVDLDEADVRVLASERDDLGRDDLARAAPLRVEVDHELEREKEKQMSRYE